MDFKFASHMDKALKVSKIRPGQVSSHEPIKQNHISTLKPKVP